MDASRDTAILAAALQLVAEVGYERVTMDAIATRCRASKATIYRRWDSKASLVSDAMREHKREVACLPDTGDIRGDLLEGLANLVEHASGDNLKLIAGLLTASQGDPELRRLMSEKMVSETEARSQEWKERAVARGEIPADFDADLIQQIAPAVIFMRLLITNEPVDEAFRVHLVDNVLMPLLTCPQLTPADLGLPADIADGCGLIGDRLLAQAAAIPATGSRPAAVTTTAALDCETDLHDVINS
jgi:AcrR family transcriptional regulator